MADITVKTIDDIPPYSGPHEIPGIRFHPAREALGVSAWGMNVLQLAPGCEGYPEHDHVKDGQEEVYVVLEGSISFEAKGEVKVLSQGAFVRVAPEVRRRFFTTDSPATILAIGGTPDKAYRPSMGG